MSWIIIMTLSGRTLFWLILCASFLRGYADDASHIRGVPGKDYPNYSSIPQTSFRCSEQLHIPGLYADPETRCQVFHHCYEHRQESFLCPLGTVFNQGILACDYWYSADCSAAPLYYGSNSPHQVMIYDVEPGFVPIKNSPDNLLDKMASLYEVNDGFSIPDDSGNEAYSHEDNNYFSDRELIVQNKPAIKNINFIETTDHYDRPSITFDELPEEYEYVQNTEVPEPEDNIQNFEDSFEGSGQLSDESKELEEDSYLRPVNDKGDFENQQFVIVQEEHVEEKTKPHDHSYYEDEQNDHLTDFSHKLHSSSKVSSASEEKLVRRYSGNNANPYSRKSVRRKPKFTIIESETKTTDQSEDKVSTSSIDSDDKVRISASTESMSVSNFLDSSVTSYKAKRRRKPIVIDLEDSLQYNINSASQPDGGVGVNYEVNSQSEIPGVSIAAQEISVKLIPSEANRKRKSVHYNIEKEEETESSTASYVTSPASNIHYETTTFPHFNKFEIKDEEFAANLNVITPIRKKNKIRIIDSEDNYIDIDDREQEDTLLPILQFQDGTRVIEKEFQVFEDHSSDTFEETKEISERELLPSLKEDDVETDPSYFITEYDAVTLSNIVPDDHYILQETHNDEQGTLFQKSDDLDQSYISHLNNESSLETEQFEDDSEIDDRTDSVTFKSLVGFDSTTYDDEMQDETYFTTEPISEIPTSIPLEIQNTKDSEAKTYSIPQSNFESEYDYSDIFRNTWRPVPITLEGNHVMGLLESGSFDFHPLLEESNRDETTELPLSEDFELQTIISDSYESYTENEQFPNTEIMGNILYQNNRNSVPSMSTDIASNNHAHSEELSTASDIELDAEFIDYLSHSNSNSDSSAKLDAILTESKQTVKDISSKQFSEIQRHLIGKTVDFDAMKEQDEGVKNQTVILESNANLPHPPKLADTDVLDRIDLKNIAHKGNDESKGIQGVIDLSNDFPETSNQHDFVPPVTTNAILEISENPQFWNNINAFLNDALNSNQKLSKNADIKADSSQVINDNQFKTSEKTAMNKAHSGGTNRGGIKNAKARPLRSSRTLASPHQMGYNMEAFGSQYLSGFPSSVLKLKQSNIQKLLLYSGPAFENGAFYTRTGSLLESPKISKLISIGKNLLRSKKAKFRILSRYVSSFKSNQ